MRRFPTRTLASLLALAAAACGDDGLRVGGTFARPGDAPLLVWAAEAEREARVEDGAFAFEGLAPGPVTLVVRSEGRDLGRIELRDVVSAGAVEMEGLRIDAASGRAFPASVRLKGPRRVSINGVRFAAADALPASVAADGVVLAVSHADGAMLFRPADGTLPDLRVVFGSHHVDADRVVRPIAAGDSARVEGVVEDGYVIASRIAPPGDSTPSGTDTPATEAESSPASPASSEPSSTSPTVTSSRPASAASAPSPRIRETPPGHRDRPGRGRGHAKKPKKG